MAQAASAPNPYLPRLMEIAGMRDETPDVRTLALQLLEGEDPRSLPGWQPGQFGEFTVFGAGECVFALANTCSSPGALPAVECTFRAIGKVTNALRQLSPGQMVGFRGPYGNAFPLADWRGRGLVFIGGGIGMAALRAAIQSVLENRDFFGDVVILNGARTVDDMVYKEEMKEWAGSPGVRVLRTVDPGGEAEGWDGEVGLLPDVFEKLGLPPEDRMVVACGPPVMLHFMFKTLEKLEYSPDQVTTTLENKMKCGIGHCGRCNIGSFYVCRDGPVVTWAELAALPRDL